MWCESWLKVLEFVLLAVSFSDTHTLWRRSAPRLSAFWASKSTLGWGREFSPLPDDPSFGVVPLESGDGKTLAGATVLSSLFFCTVLHVPPQRAWPIVLTEALRTFGCICSVHCSINLSISSGMRERPSASALLLPRWYFMVKLKSASCATHLCKVAFSLKWAHRWEGCCLCRQQKRVHSTSNDGNTHRQPTSAPEIWVYRNACGNSSMGDWVFWTHKRLLPSSHSALIQYCPQSFLGCIAV